MPDPFTRLVGAALIAIGVLWIVDVAADIGIPWEWVVPVLLILLGLVLVLAPRRRNGVPPSQFERDEAPPVP